MKHFKIHVETWDGVECFFASTNSKDSRAQALVSLLREQIEDGDFIPHNGNMEEGSLGTLRFHVQAWDGTNQKERMSGTSAKQAFKVQAPKVAPAEAAAEEDSEDIA